MSTTDFLRSTYSSILFVPLLLEYATAICEGIPDWRTKGSDNFLEQGARLVWDS